MPLRPEARSSEEVERREFFARVNYYFSRLFFNITTGSEYVMMSSSFIIEPQYTSRVMLLLYTIDSIPIESIQTNL